MADPNAHPLDEVLREFPGVERVTLRHERMQRSRSTLPVILVALAVNKSDVGMGPDCERFNLRFIEGGVQLERSPNTSPDKITAISSLGDMPDGVHARHTVGLSRCQCSAGNGGPRWNPLSITLVDKGMPLELAERIMERFIALVREQPERFCVPSVAMLRKHRLI